MDDAELKGAKAVVSSQHANDFDAACAYFLGGFPTSCPVQLEAARCRRQKHGIYAVETGGHGGGQYEGMKWQSREWRRN
jgi:hypothetical protein